nr:MAG TPA: hypothetical protein [Caudoviricetes sp.]
MFGFAYSSHDYKGNRRLEIFCGVFVLAFVKVKKTGKFPNKPTTILGPKINRR